jgi:hypothetical protein
MTFAEPTRGGANALEAVIGDRKARGVDVIIIRVPFDGSAADGKKKAHARRRASPMRATTACAAAPIPTRAHRHVSQSLSGVENPAGRQPIRVWRL